MDRFHIVISNYVRLRSFVDNFDHLRGFAPQRDRVYIFDCSPDARWKKELAYANLLTATGLQWGTNLFFVRRRNWGVNHGAQLDYLRCLRDGKIALPQYIAFMQEHYLDLRQCVKEDTIPEDAIFDLNDIQARFDADPDIGCGFYSRYGVRVVTSNPIEDGSFFGDGAVLLPGAVRRGFCIDGGNFITRPALYLTWFDKHPSRLTCGNGSYGFAHVWEARLGMILYQQEIKWADLYRNVTFRTIVELDTLETKLGRPISMLWYDHRIWYFFYGRDQQLYPPKPLHLVLRYLIWDYVYHLIFQNRDTRLVFIQPGESGE